MDPKSKPYYLFIRAADSMTVHDHFREGCSRQMCWDEENRLAGFSDCHNAGFYQYDVNGERTYKLTGERVLQNIGGQWYSHQILDNPTLYVSPYLVCTPQGYTKHYYAESERIASRIGSGGLSDSQDIPHVIEMPEEEPEEPEEPDEPEEPLNPGDPGGVLIPDWPAEPDEPEKPEEPVEPAEQEKQPTPPFGLDWDFEGNMSELFDRKQLSSLEQMDKALSCAGTAFEIADDPLDIEGWAVLQNPDEPDCYWYHPDHLGSSSWITYTDGSAVQHLHYLPWGEDYVDQRTTNWSALHTFSAKERDSETGLSYFGARYYSRDLSIWLSVDPMSDKYPSLSPYVYCANNPVKLIDFDGQDWVLVTGNAALWYGGEVGDKSNLIHTYKATSGLNNATTTTGAIIDCQYAKYQNVRNGGPTPEGQYYINLKPDPNRIANADPKTGQLLRSPEGGIEKIPDYYQREDGHYCTYSEWGKHRAKLEPVSVTGASNRDNNSFYIHDSEKGFTHGCIEIEKEFFNDLMEYGDDNSKIDVIIEYPGPDHNTNGGTKKTVITE